MLHPFPESILTSTESNITDLRVLYLSLIGSDFNSLNLAVPDRHHFDMANIWENMPERYRYLKSRYSECCSKNRINISEEFSVVHEHRFRVSSGSILYPLRSLVYIKLPGIPIERQIENIDLSGDLVSIFAEASGGLFWGRELEFHKFFHDNSYSIPGSLQLVMDNGTRNPFDVNLSSPAIPHNFLLLAYHLLHGSSDGDGGDVVDCKVIVDEQGSVHVATEEIISRDL